MTAFRIEGEVNFPAVRHPSPVDQVGLSRASGTGDARGRLADLITLDDDREANDREVERFAMVLAPMLFGDFDIQEVHDSPRNVFQIEHARPARDAVAQPMHDTVLCARMLDAVDAVFGPVEAPILDARAE